MTCPCPRPPGLTDDEVRGILGYIGDEVPEYVARRGHPYPIVGDAQTRRVWHVVEWRRCGAVGSGGGRCVWPTGHLPQPAYHTAPFPNRPGGGQAWHAAPVDPPAGEPTWPVPCWCVTAEEAERWRPAPAPPEWPNDEELGRMIDQRRLRDHEQARAFERRGMGGGAAPAAWAVGDWAVFEDRAPAQVRQVLVDASPSSPRLWTDQWLQPASRCRRVPGPSVRIGAGSIEVDAPGGVTVLPPPHPDAHRPHDPSHCDRCRRGEPLIRVRVREVTDAQRLQLQLASRGLTFVLEPTPEEIRADERARVQAALAIGAGLAEAEQLRRRRRELCPKHNPFPSERSSTVWSPSCPGCAPWARWDDPSRPDVDAMARARRQRWAIGGGL